MSAKSPNENSPNEKSKSRKLGLARRRAIDLGGRFQPRIDLRSGSTVLFEQVKNRDYGAIVRDVWDAIDLWRATRDWKRMLWFLPSFLLLTGFLGVVYWGSPRVKTSCSGNI